MDQVIAVEHVTRSYGDFMLRDVSFALPRGYIMGLIGPNGAGKTTLIAMMLGLVRPDGGTVRVLGADPDVDSAAIKRRIGFVHEVSTFYDHLTVSAFGALVGRFYPAWQAATFTRLAHEFDLPLTTACGKLSRGTRTKVSLAIALSHDAELLILDEPTSGLDPLFRRDLLERLAAFISEGRTSVLFSTHITADLERVADYVTFIQRGSLVFSSTRDDVMDRWGVVRGDVSRLDAHTQGLFRGTERSGQIFTAVTDDIAEARRRLTGPGFVIERASLEDIMVYTGRTC